MMRSPLYVVIAAALLALAGCSGSRVYGSAGPADQQATMLIGMAAWGPGLASVRLTWQQYDPATQTLLPKEFIIERSHVGCGGIKLKTPEECALDKMFHDVLAIPAGDYVLASVVAGYPGRVQTTSFVRIERGGLGGHYVQTSGSIAGSKAPRYHFNAGEVAYVGDWTFDAARFPATVTSFRRDDAAAQAALAARHPEIQHALAFRLPGGAAGPVPANAMLQQLEGVRQDSSTVK